MRKWGDSSVSAEDMAALDYSAELGSANFAGGKEDLPKVSVDVDSLVSADALGSRNAAGAYEVADWDFRNGHAPALPTEDDILARGADRLILDNTEKPKSDSVNDSGGWSKMFARLSGKKVLTKDDLQPILADMEKHLMSKNVAKDIAEKLCDAVGAALVGKKLGGLTSLMFPQFT